jgi:hypothetical protein
LKITNVAGVVGVAGVEKEKRLLTTVCFAENVSAE